MNQYCRHISLLELANRMAISYILELRQRRKSHVAETAFDFVNHWTWAGSKGLMATKTAMAYAVACRSVLSVQDGWESLEFEALDVDNFLLRFKNLRKTDFKPQSLATYEGRFRRAVELYQKYLENPSGWKYNPRRPSRDTQTRRRNLETTVQTPAPASVPQERAESTDDVLQEYTYPFRLDILARLVIPRDATTAEINRLVAWARTLAVDYEPPT